MPMLKKAAGRKTDWAKLLPLALYAIRLTPSSATGFSPYALVHGREIHSPVDLLYQGWVEHGLEKCDVSTWAGELADKNGSGAYLRQEEVMRTRKREVEGFSS